MLHALRYSVTPILLAMLPTLSYAAQAATPGSVAAISWLNAPAHTPTPKIRLVCTWPGINEKNGGGVGKVIWQRRVKGTDTWSTPSLGTTGEVTGGGDTDNWDLTTTAGMTYEYQAKASAVTGMTDSAWSDPVEVTAVSGTYRPILDISNDNITATTVDLTYFYQVGTVGSTDKVKVFRSQDGSSSWIEATPAGGITWSNSTTGSSQWAWRNAGLTPNTVYYYRTQVSADGGAFSAFSNTLRVRTSFSHPLAVMNLHPRARGSTSGWANFDNLVLLKANYPALASFTGLQYEFRKATDATWTTLVHNPSTPGASTLLPDPFGNFAMAVTTNVGAEQQLAPLAIRATALTPSSTYEFRVTGLEGSVPNTGHQATVRFTTLDDQVPPAPINLTASMADTCVSLGWSNLAANGGWDSIGFRDGASQQGVRIYRRTGSSGDWTLIHTTTSPTTQAYRDTGLASGTAYSYRLQAVGAGGTSPFSSTFFTSTTGTGPDTTTLGLSPGATVAAIPTLSVAGGTYATPQTVTLACTTPGATIHYTTDGSLPTTAASIARGPLTIAVTTTLTAMAIASGVEDSDVTSATYTITTPPSGSVAGITATDPGATEAGATTGTYTVTMTPAASADTVVNLSFSGAVLLGSDVVSIPTSLTFLSGQSTRTITLTPIDDADFEADEGLTIAIAPGTGYTVGTAGSATVTIVSNDLEPVVPVAQVTAAASGPTPHETGPVNGSFTISLSAAPASPLNIAYALTGATLGSDFTGLAASSVTMTGTSQVLTVNILDDAEVEGSETLTLTLLSGTGYTLGLNSQAGLTIQDNEPVTGKVASIAATTPTALESPLTAGAFRIGLDGATASALTVQFTVSGTATSGTDYLSLATSAVIPAGADGISLTVTPLADGASEGGETVLITLTAGTGYTVGSSATATVNLLDASAPEIAVLRDGQTIASGATDAYATPLTVGNATSIATGIANLGTSTLDLSAGVVATPTGCTVLVTPPSSAVTAGASSDLVLAITPTTTAWNVVLSLASNDADENPAMWTLSGTATAGMSAGTLAWNGTSATVAESTGTVSLSVQRTGGSAGAVGITWSVLAGTASGGDYTTTSGTLSWGDGVTADATVVIGIADDSTPEPDEVFTVTLSTPTGGAVLGSAAVATVTIRVSDPGTGDLTQDGRVESSDLSLVLRHMGETSSSPGWDPAADTTLDGQVTAEDWNPVLLHFGSTFW